MEEISEALFQAPIALGTIANLEQEMSAALAPAHQEAVAAVRQAPVQYVDETGWKQGGLRCRDRKTKRFCARLLGVYPALWTLVVVEGVEPTNNHVERAQRRASPFVWLPERSRLPLCGAHSDRGANAAFARALGLAIPQ